MWFPGGQPDAAYRLLDLLATSEVDGVDPRQFNSRALQRAVRRGAGAPSTDRLLSDTLRSQRPDVLVSDIGMPGASGYELIRRVRALPLDLGGQTPAVALTAYARTEDRMNALAAGFNMHVLKPIEPAELVVVIASLVARMQR